MATHTQNIEKLYVAYFNRPADPVGLQFWDQQLTAQAGSSTAFNAIAEAFSHSDEYINLYTNMSATQRVDQIYLNLFGRHADASGLLFWANNLSSGALSVGNIVTTIANAALGNDLLAINSKVAAATWFTSTLDTPSEILAYNGAQAIAAERVKLQSVVDQQSLANYIDQHPPLIIHTEIPSTPTPPSIGLMADGLELTGQAPLPNVLIG